MSEKSSCPWDRAWGPRAQTPWDRQDETVGLHVSLASDQNPPAPALKLFHLVQAPFGSACRHLKAFSVNTSCRACMRLPDASRQYHGGSLVSIWGTMKARAGKKRSGCIIARFARHESGPGRMVTDGPRQSGETRCRRWSGLFDIGRMDGTRLCRCQGRDAAVRLRHKKTKGCRHRLSEVATLLSFFAGINRMRPVTDLSVAA
ncbi:hypothetical protein SAMN05443432_106178 [Roseovarius litoreus]|uniref:Uncharacterized protein n=1 Tax=Roseovarius litoreus TaxID=1155722 RepID=A0A1M7HX94_9RHOB|nr:hypothetical protein SAMN05443432_106178 [Roseovarius litoreus]